MPYASTRGAYPDLLRRDRERRGFTVGQVAWRFGVKPQEYRKLEAGERFPDFETWDRICNLYQCRRSFSERLKRGRGSRHLVRPTAGLTVGAWFVAIISLTAAIGGDPTAKTKRVL